MNVKNTKIVNNIVSAIDPDMEKCEVCKDWCHITNCDNIIIQMKPDIIIVRMCNHCADDHEYKG